MYNSPRPLKKSNQTLECGIAVIQDEKGRILISKRRYSDSYGGYWEFPGGKKRPSETFEECVIREAHEELGIHISIKQFLKKIDYRYPDHPVSLHFYLCHLEEGEPRCGICEECKWVFPKECEKETFLPASLPILALL